VDDFELELKSTFIDEAILNLEEVEGCFMELEGASDSKDLLDRIFRLAHNLKGGSRSVGFGDVAQFTHELENLVLAVQKDKVKLTSEVISTLLRSNDRIVEMMHTLKQDMNATFNNEEMIEEIKSWIDGTRVSSDVPSAKLDSRSVDTEMAATATPIPPSDAFFESEKAVVPVDAEGDGNGDDDEVFQEIVEIEGTAEGDDRKNETSDSETQTKLDQLSSGDNSDSDPAPVNASRSRLEDANTGTENRESTIPSNEQVLADVLDLVKSNQQQIKLDEKSREKPTATGARSSTLRQDKEDEVVRVSLSRIELLNDYVGELIVLQSVIQQQSQGRDQLKLQTSIQQMVKLSKEIQNLSMGLRMLPVKPLVQKLQRVVRDTATMLQKNVRLEVVGDQMDVDKSVLDQLGDPLIHILRNAVDHGLESTEERAATKKNPQGVVRLSFHNEGNHLIIEVVDDGKGINADIVRKKAIEKRIIAAHDALSEKQIINLIFHAGFSTKAVTSEVSGRGVGMDVVKTNVEKIGGMVDVSTQLGSGSNFKLKIPLSLAVIEGLVVATTRGRYVVPLSQVQETVNLGSVDIQTQVLGIGDCMQLRGQVVPIYRLERLLESNRREEGGVKDSTALLFFVEERLVAVSVKELMHSQQVVIKALNNGIQRQKGWVGSCVLGDGLPTLIVNPPELLEGKVVGASYDHSTQKKGAA
jgi:two-component system, chemotaxis family, sensor kinase CheA